jgi:hypothetical protein
MLIKLTWFRECSSISTFVSFYVACQDTIPYFEPVTGHTCQSYIDYGFCNGTDVNNTNAINAVLARQNCVACGKCMYTSVQIIVFCYLRFCSTGVPPSSTTTTTISTNMSTSTTTPQTTTVVPRKQPNKNGWNSSQIERF